MKNWEKKFDEQFTARDSFRMMQSLDNVKAFIRTLLDKKEIHLKQLQHRCLKQDSYINQMEEIIKQQVKSQCADELEEVYHKPVDIGLFLIEITNLIKKWRKK